MNCQKCKCWQEMYERAENEKRALAAERDGADAVIKNMKAAISKLLRPRKTNWANSCDQCTHQEGRHYCLLIGKTMKNMDTICCGAFKRKKAFARRSNI